MATISKISSGCEKKFVVQGAIWILPLNETDGKEIHWRQAVTYWERQPIKSTILKIKLNILAIQMATISKIKLRLWKKFVVQGAIPIISLNERKRN